MSRDQRFFRFPGVVSIRARSVASVAAAYVLAAAVFVGALFPHALAAQVAEPGGDAPGSPLRQIFVPVEELDVVINRDKKGVLLPRNEFEQMFQKARQNAGRDAPLDVGIVLANADLQARIAGKQLLVSASFEVTQLVDGWRLLQLPLTGFAVERVTLDDQPAKLGRSPEDDSTVTLFNNQAGTKTLQMELSTRLASVGSDQVAGFGLPGSPTGTLRITAPAGKQLLIDGLDVNRPKPIDEDAEYEFAIGGRKTVQLQMTERREKESADALVFANSAFGIHVAPGEVTWQAVTSLQVFGTSLDRLVFSVPNSLEIANVESSGLEAWELADDTDDERRTSITLSYRQPFVGSRKIVLRGVVTRFEDNAWSVPDLKIRNSTSHIGQIVIAHPPEVRLLLLESSGVRPVASDTAIENDSTKGSSSRLAFDVWQEGFSLDFVTQAKKRTVLANVLSVLEMTQRRLELESVSQIETLYAPLFDVEAELPADWTVLQVTIDGDVVPWQTLRRQAGMHQIRVPFAAPLVPGNKVTLILTAHRDLEDWPPDVEGTEFDLPEIHFSQADVVEGSLGVRADDDFIVEPIDVTGLDPAPLNLEGIRLGYRYRDTRFSGRLKLSSKPARIAARTLTFTRLDPQVLRSHVEIELTITGGGLRNLEIALPEAVAEQARFSVAGPTARIIEQNTSEAAEGERICELRFDRRVKGKLRLTTSIETPRDDAESFNVHAVRIPEAQRQSGVAAIEASGEQRLDLGAVGEDGLTLPTVDAVDIPPTRYRPRERIVAAYRYVVPGYNITLAEKRFERHSVPTAICHQGSIETVLGETGEFQHHAKFHVVAVGVQSLRVALPEGATLWATLIDAEPVEARRTQNVFLVPLPPSGNADSVRALEVFYTTDGEPLRTRGQLHQQPPELSVVGGDGSPQPLDVLNRNWVVHYPRDTALVASDGLFQTAATLDGVSWLRDVPRSLSTTSPGQLALKLLFVAIAAGVVVILVRGHVRWGMLGVIAACGLVITLSVAFILSFSRDMAYRDANAKFGAARDSLVGDDEKIRARTSQSIAKGQRAGGDWWEAMESTSTSDVPIALSPGAGTNGNFIADWGPDQTIAGGEAAGDDDVRRFDMQYNGPFNGFRGTDGGLLPQVQRQSSERKGNPGSDFTDLESDESAKPDTFTSDGDVGFRQGSFKSENGEVDFSRRYRDALDGSSDTIMHGERTQGNVPFGSGGGIGGGGFGGGGDPAEGQVQAGTTVLRGRQSDVDQVQQIITDMENADSAGARLSVMVAFERPENHLAKKFRYVGTKTAPVDALNLTYENRISTSAHRLLVFLATVCVFWLARSRSSRVRSMLAVMGIVLPVALVSIAPTIMHAALDGLFFGTCGGLLLWLGGPIAVRWSRVRGAIRSSKRSTLTAGLFLLAISLCVHQATAAEPPPPSANQAAAPQNEPSAPPVDSIEDYEPPAPDAENVDKRDTVIVPYVIGSDPLAADRVYLPHAEFLKLWNRAYPEKRILGPAPVDGLVTAAIYSAELKPAAANNGETKNQGIVTVSGRIVCHSFRKQQIVLPVPIGSVALTSATLDGRPAVLDWKGDGKSKQLHVVIGEPGVHILDVSFDVPAEFAGPAGRFTLPLEAVAAGRLSFVLPAEDLDVRVNGSSGSFRKVNGDDRPQVEIPIDRGGEVSVSWRPQQQRGAGDAIVIADSTAAVIVDDAGAQTDIRFTFQVRQGSVSEILFSWPNSVKVKQVRGEDVAGWQLDDSADERILRVFLRRPISKGTAMSFELYQPTSIDESPAPVEFPRFAPQNITRETGRVGVFAGEQFSLQAVPGAGGRQIDLEQYRAPEGLGQPAVDLRFAYRYSARPFELMLTVSRRVPQSRCDAEHAVKIGRRNTQLSSRFRLNLTGAPRSRIAFYLPDNFLPLSLDGTDLADWYLHDDDDQKLAIVELATPRTGLVEMILNGTLTATPEDDTADLDIPVPLDVDRIQSRLGVWIDSAYTAVLDAHEGWKTVAVDQLSSECRSLDPQPPQFVLRSDSTEPEFVTFSLKRSVTRLIADSVSVVTTTDASLHYTFALNWKIDRAASDEFVFVTDGRFAGELDFEAPGLRGVTEQELPDGTVRFVVTTQQPRSGRYFLTAEATLPPPTEKIVSAAAIQFETRDDAGNFQPLETQEHYVVLVNHSSGQLTATNADDFESIDATELPIKVFQALVDRAAWVVRTQAGQSAPQWRVERFERQPGAPASVNLADLLTVVERDASFRAAAIYRIKNRSRQFLAIEMPQNVKLLSVFVKGRPSRTVETTIAGGPVQLIALPKTSAADLSFRVRLIYSGRLDTGPLPRNFRFTSSELELPAPRVISLDDDAEFGIPVARTRWTVFFPDDYDAVPIEDLTQSNLRPTAKGESNMINEMLHLAEAAELTNVLLGESSRRVKYEALTNLDKVEGLIRQSEAQDNYGDSDEVRRHRNQRQRVLKELRSNRAKLQVDDAKKKADLNKNGMLGVEISDEERTGQQLREQTQQLYMTNSASLGFGGEKDSGSDDAKATHTFGFEMSTPQAPAMGGLKLPAKSDQGKSADEAGRRPRGEGKSPQKKSDGKEINRFRQNRRDRSQTEEELSDQLMRQKTLHKAPGRAGRKSRSGRLHGVDVDAPVVIDSSKSMVQSEDKNHAIPEAAPQAPAIADDNQEIPEDVQYKIEAIMESETVPEAVIEAAPETWTQVGGLSLPINVPTAGHSLTFSKIGGSPKLTVGVRPRHSVEQGLDWIWTVIWVAVGIIVLLAVGGSKRFAVRHPVTKSLMAAGLIAFFALPTFAAWLGFTLFCAAALGYGFSRSRAAR